MNYFNLNNGQADLWFILFLHKCWLYVFIFWAVLGGLNLKRTKISTFEKLTANVFLI